MTRVLVCGGRWYAGRAALFNVLDRAHADQPISLIIHGAASGADSLAGEWAAARGVRVESYPAAWNVHGRRAGPIRNGRMLRKGKPDIVFAFPGGDGTADMIDKAKRAGVPGIMFKAET